MLCTLLLVYLTPLKWVTVIQPMTKDVDPATFYNDYKNHPQDFIFIDVRSADEYQTLHAEGAVNIALTSLYDIHDTLPKRGKEIVLICSGGRESGIAYMYLQHYGFFNIERVNGGLKNWVLEKLPVESSLQATSSAVQ